MSSLCLVETLKVQGLVSLIGLGEESTIRAMQRRCIPLRASSIAEPLLQYSQRKAQRPAQSSVLLLEKESVQVKVLEPPKAAYSKFYRKALKAKILESKRISFPRFKKE